MLALSIILGAGLLLMAAVAGRDVRRATQWLSEQPCRVCGTVYGRAAIRASDEYTVRCDRESRAKPGLQVHFTPEWIVKCPSCAAVSRFNFETYRLGE